MKKKLATWQSIKDSLEVGIPVMLLYVLESKGSSPGRQGFFMMVSAQGNMQGSIGGGIMEHKLVELARERLQTTNAKPQVKKQVHDKAATRDQSGMICSGEQTVFLYPIQQKDEANISKVIACLQQKETGTLQLSPEGLHFEDGHPATHFLYSFNTEADWLYREKMGYANRLYIIGGGHCALALSALMSTMDFYIHLFDDREELFTMMKNEVVHEKTVLEDYRALTDLVPSGQNVYVVIMTFGYRTDDIVVRALLGKEFRYLGLMGSKAKIQKMFDTYRSEGIAEKYLQNIHAPVGIAINSETPEEIAVSIAAQIIQEKNK